MSFKKGRATLHVISNYVNTEMNIIIYFEMNIIRSPLPPILFVLVLLVRGIYPNDVRGYPRAKANGIAKN